MLPKMIPVQHRLSLLISRGILEPKQQPFHGVLNVFNGGVLMPVTAGVTSFVMPSGTVMTMRISGEVALITSAPIDLVVITPMICLIGFISYIAKESFRDGAENYKYNLVNGAVIDNIVIPSQLPVTLRHSC